jgi:aryl-alcohol dehydrogenase-like predicted oxidoreductase
MSRRLSRRAFVGAVAGTAAAAAREQSLPTRPFGRTGEKITILAIGCGNRLWAAYGEEGRGIEALNLAYDSGIRYFDTAQGYGDGKSEAWVGKSMRTRRKDVIFATKTSARRYDDVLSRCDESLKRLQTDHLDVLHIHGLTYADDLERIEKLGTVRALRRLRDQKIVRFIGVTSHADPATLALALDRYDFDCTQMALNAGLQGRSPDGQGYWKKGGNNDLFGEPIAAQPFPGASFQDVALKVAVRRQMGIIAMKVTGQEALIGSGATKADASQLIRYALSHPVSAVTIGMPKLDYIRQNTELARTFRSMSAGEMEQLSARLARANKTALDFHFNHEHRDA